MRIRGREIPGRLVLAPLSRLGNLAFRQLVDEMGGCPLKFSEMAGARGVPCGNGHMLSGYYFRPGETDGLVCQLYGNDPEEMARAARRVEQDGFFGVDINLGCAVKSVTRHGCGAALLKDPDRAAAIITAVRNATGLPLFVKFRTGWRDDPAGAVALARRFEDAGADALTFHPRVAPDRRTRPPRWAYIRDVKRAVEIPVFGNGNVFDRDDALRMKEETGCDGIALGRLALARPWTFSQWGRGAAGMAAASPGNTVPGSEHIGRDTALRLLELNRRYFDPETALRRFRKYVVYFAAGFKFGHNLYTRVQKSKDPDEVRERVISFFDTPQEMVTRPNISILR
ncbi:MAG: tRNA-dihydrouridine synthase [Desulfobacterales bacterium]|nr:MAG: tRNA-dihydrouridine synthase [Desulfobacterales bacterium]